MDQLVCASLGQYGLSVGCLGRYLLLTTVTHSPVIIAHLSTFKTLAQNKDYSVSVASVSYILFSFTTELERLIL